MSQKISVRLDLHDDKGKRWVLKTISSLPGVDSTVVNVKDMELTVVGNIDPVDLVTKLRKKQHAEIISVSPLVKEKEKEEGGGGGGSGCEKKKDPNEPIIELVRAYQAYNLYMSIRGY